MLKIKDAYSNLQPRPSTFFQDTQRLWYHKLSHVYLKDFYKIMCEVPCTQSVQFRRNQLKKPLENVKMWFTTILKTITNINIVFSNKIHICNVFISVILVGKVTISANLIKIRFSKISEQVALRFKPQKEGVQMRLITKVHLFNTLPPSMRQKNHIFHMGSMTPPAT